VTSKILAAIAIVVILATSGCFSLDRAYVIADRDTYDAFEESHREYVEGDGSLDDDQKARRLRLLETWEERIRAAEEKLDLNEGD